MTFRSFVTLAVLAGALLVLYRIHTDPYGTRLPIGTSDLGSVHKALAKLTDDERALVEAYARRSRGDVLPVQFADPDDPLTARTFAEPIELQRVWETKRKAQEAQLAELRAQHEARLAPLRAQVRASVVKAEIVTRNEYQARRNPYFYQQPYQVDTSPTFLTRIRVENLGNQPIVALRGSLEASDSQAYLSMDLCWIDLDSDEAIAAGDFLEFYCGHDYRGASQQQRDFVNRPEGRFEVKWEPRYVKLASGVELKSE